MRLGVNRIVLCLLVAFFPTYGIPQGYSPKDAPKKMTLAEGFEVKLVSCESTIRQPVAIEFDDRGRLWCIQYLQYPNPEGLKRTKVDRYSRTVYDRIPEPPPKGPKGADRITILSDFDSQGKATRSKDFVGNLNLTSGIAFGHGGVFVLQVPYLLFYPDRNRDDIPDSDPEVLLKGFGMEDAHSVANSLTWGPDGWLYGCQGSTVTANINGIEFQQGVWRYHPITRKFELFCEGGGNSWGLDFDRDGNLFYSTNFGGFTMLHGVQGAYYWKLFTKHGALHNPHTFGYIDHVPHHNFTGGHVTVGGIVYEGDSFPYKYRGRYVAADLLGHGVYSHHLTPDGSSFRSAHGGELLLANDSWFAPSDVTLGPDGSIYVTDWHDKRTAHPDPDAEWDRTNGRIYKIEAKGTKPLAEFDLSKLNRDQLLKLLSHPNDWFRRRARIELASRRDPEVIFPLRTQIVESRDPNLQLQSLWALYVSGGFTEDFAKRLLQHTNPSIRRWTVRFLGDEDRVSETIAQSLRQLAEKEPNPHVRSQLSCSAKRLPSKDAIPIIQALISRDLDSNDPHIPLLLWWALEKHCVASLDSTLAIFATEKVWTNSIIRNTILARLMRRYAAEANAETLQACLQILRNTPVNELPKMLFAFDQGLPNSIRIKDLPKELIEKLHPINEDSSKSIRLRILTRLGDSKSTNVVLGLAFDPNQSEKIRLEMLRILATSDDRSIVAPVLKILDHSKQESIRLALLDILQRFDSEEISTKLLRSWPTESSRIRNKILDTLITRKTSSKRLLNEIDPEKVKAKDVPLEQVRRIALHQDPDLDRLVRKHWGNIGSSTPEEKLAEVRRLNNDLRAGSGNLPNGHQLYTKHCATCHELFGEGNAIGPELTHANRKDRDFLLVSLVDPNGVIRKEYLSYNVRTVDGRLLTGRIVNETPQAITLVDAKNQKTEIARDHIEKIQESPTSLMPEGLLKELKPQELRDLFAYLQSDTPKKAKR